MDEHAADGIYRIPAMKKGLFRAAARELTDAVPRLRRLASLPWEGAEIPEHYGWVAGSLPSPDAEGATSSNSSRSARCACWPTSTATGARSRPTSPWTPTRRVSPSSSSPATQSNPIPPSSRDAWRCAMREGSWREAARFRRFQDRYTLYDSWFDFGRAAPTSPIPTH